MIALATHTTNAPDQAQRGPARATNERIGPERVFRPRPSSSRISGTDQRKRKAIQAMRNSPPPFLAAIRGKRQMFPVPTAMPSMASIMAHLEPKREGFIPILSIRRTGDGVDHRRTTHVRHYACHARGCSNARRLQGAVCERVPYETSDFPTIVCCGRTGGRIVDSIAAG